MVVNEKICSMKEKVNLHALAVKLCEGQPVFFQGHSIRARVIPQNYWACYFCDMDCLCNEDMRDLCLECDDYDRKKHILYLLSTK